MESYVINASLIYRIKNTLITEGIIPTNIMPLSGKLNEPKYLVETHNGKYFAKFSAYKRFLELGIQNRRYCLLPFLSKTFSDINRQLNVYTWLDGEDLKRFLSSKDCGSNYEYGVKSGMILKRLHRDFTIDIPIWYD